MKVLIVGAGIAGTTLALALQRAGVGSHLLETREEADGGGGAFLTLAPNGVNALHQLGLGDVPAAAGGVEVAGIDFYNARGRQIARLDGTTDEERYGARSVLLRRAGLVRELLARAREAGVPMTSGARLARIEHADDGVTAALEDGRTVAGDVLVGADGIWSTVRRLTWPEAPQPTYTGMVDCGGWTRVDLPDTPRQQMQFGHRAFFGHVVTGSVAYWFSNVPRAEAPERGELDRVAPATWMAQLRELHADDAPTVRTILRSSTEAVGSWPLYDMPALSTWHRGRVCLVGDAAHATSPSVGQGASLAVEDAAVLARHLAGSPDPEAALASFVAARKRRAERVVEMGRRIGRQKVGATAGSLVRDLLLPVFLRMGARSTRDLYAYRVDPVPAVEATGTV